jgi:hypothetical protein
VSYGFLHANPVHLLSSLFSLTVCGPLLERRLGASNFLLLYFAALVGAAIVAIAIPHGSAIETGASGALFGILGALFALWVLGAPDLSPAYFLGTFALNFAISARAPQADWAAHAGGFITGMACIALFDGLARSNALWLRCKFPEFVKLNLLVIVVGATALWFFGPAILPGRDPRLLGLGAALGAVLLIKLLDLLLAVRHGLIGTVLVLAVGNGAVAYGFGEIGRSVLDAASRLLTAFPEGAELVHVLGMTTASTLLGIGAVLLTCIVYLRPLRRGIRDVGFVGATYVGDRGRENGLVRPAKYTRA